MAYDFTEDDFSPKSQHTFTDEDFLPKTQRNTDIDAGLDFFQRTHPELYPQQGPGIQPVDSTSAATPVAPAPAPAPGTIGPTPFRPPPISAMAQQMARGEPVTQQPGEVLEEPVSPYRLQHPQTPFEVMQMPTSMPVPKMSEETGTKIAGYIDKLRAGQSTPEQLKAGGQIIAGGEQAIAGIVDFMTSPAGMATVMTAGVMGPEVAGARLASLTQRGISSAYALDMLRNAPDQAARIMEAINSGDKLTATREIVNSLVSAAVMGHAAKGAVTPLPEAMPTPEILRRPGEGPAVPDVQDVVKNWYQNKRMANEKIVDIGGTAVPVERPMLTPGEVISEALKKEPLQPAAPEAAQPKETSASSDQKAAEVHGGVQEQPKLNEGQVPAKEGGAGVQPNVEGQAPREVSLAPHEQIAKDLGIAARKPIRNLWQFDITDPITGQPAGFSIKEGSTPEQVKAKADDLRKKFVEDIGQNLTPDIVDRLTTAELQQVMGKRGHRVGIEYGETLTEKDVPALQAKYDATLKAMKEAFGKGDIGAAQKEGAKQIFLGGALMGATKGKHPISGANYEMYLKQKAAEKAAATPASPAAPTAQAPAAPVTTSAAVPSHVKARMEGERQAKLQGKWQKLVTAPKEGRQEIIDSLTGEEAGEFVKRGEAGPPGTFDPELKQALVKKWHGPGWIEKAEETAETGQGEAGELKPEPKPAAPAPVKPKTVTPQLSDAELKTIIDALTGGTPDPDLKQSLTKKLSPPIQVQPKPEAPKRSPVVPIDEPALRKQGAEEIGDYEEEFRRAWHPNSDYLAESVRDAVGDPEFQKLYKAVTGIQLKGHSANWPNAQKGILNFIRDVTSGAKRPTPLTLDQRKLAAYVRYAHPEIFHQLQLQKIAEAAMNKQTGRGLSSTDYMDADFKEAFALDKLKGLGLTDFGGFNLDDWSDAREHVWTQKPGLAAWIEKNIKGKDLGPIAEEPEEQVMANQEEGQQARGGPTHGLPAGVPDRGPNFPAELMEASRQLGSLVRSRATLRPGVLGQFVRTLQKDLIEVGDVRNQMTVSHEIGHALDGRLWPVQNYGESQRSLAERLAQTYPTTSPQDLARLGKELHTELTPISVLMRGPMVGSPGHIQYRKRATELIADYFALYAHDRNRAATMAPKFTKGFEDSLTRDRNTEEIVQGIVAGNVVPKPPSPTLPAALAGITGTAPQPGTAMPGAVPVPPKFPPPVRERDAAVAAEDRVKGSVRTEVAEVEGARIDAEEWRKRVPDKNQRNDVGAFVEGIGNLEKPGDTIDRVRNRMTPKMERLAKDYRLGQELQRQEQNKYLKDTEEGEYLSYIEDYLGHFYVDSSAKRSAVASRFLKDSPHAKQRKLPTLKEAVEMGLTPITQDPTVTYELNARVNWRVATNRKFVADLKNITTASGEPVVVPASQAPAGWVITNNPLIQRVYARQTPGGLMLWKGGAAIHPDVWHAARQILETPISGDIGKAYDAINAFTRANAFAFSLFHDLTLRSAAVGSMATPLNPLRGLIRIMERNPITGQLELFQSTRGLGKEMLQMREIVYDAALHGLKFGFNDSEAYQHAARTFLDRLAAKLRDTPVLGKTSRLARDIQQWRQEGLWKNTHDAFKIVTYHDLVSKALQSAPPGTDVKQVKERIASLLNDAYGGQEWQTKFWMSPGTRKIFSRFFLAPDWTISTLRSVPGLSDVASTVREQAPRIAGRETFPTQKEGLGGNARRLRFWGAELAALAMATVAAQYAIYKLLGDDKKGDKPFIWDNELNQKGRVDVTPVIRHLPWTDKKDPTRHYVNLGKRPAEIINWFTDFDKQILSKASRPAAMVFEQIAGTEGDFKAPWKQDHESFIESLPKRAQAIGKQALPFSFMGNQLALSVPARKGMTKYKAQQAYESVFELATEPNRLRSFLRGQTPSEGSIAEMSKQITDAAQRNGVPALDVMRHALSVVRGHHYNEFFKAFQSGDQKKMDEEGRALLVLGSTTDEIEQSVKKRVELMPTPVE